MQLLFSKTLKIALPVVAAVFTAIGFLGDIDFIANARNSVWSPMIEFCKQNWEIVLFVMMLVFGIMYSNMTVFRSEFVTKSDAERQRKNLVALEGRVAAIEAQLLGIAKQMNANTQQIDISRQCIRMEIDNLSSSLLNMQMHYEPTTNELSSRVANLEATINNIKI